MRKRKVTIIICIVLFVLMIAPPILAPITHNDHSPRSAIRNYLQSNGHPYQSFLAVITNKNIKDTQYGALYSVLWKDWDSETGDTGTLCYAKKSIESTDKISCGTGP
ncbi:hypothetical protein AS29_014120 [Bacillus sp. SJS]|nr:hypothetical protein AS29_014120 [Bacillus sp. SJS]